MTVTARNQKRADPNPATNELLAPLSNETTTRRSGGQAGLPEVSSMP